jgi:excisionase family DNA binding protein
MFEREQNEQHKRNRMGIPKIYTIEEASEILKLKVSKLRKAIFRKEISYIKLGGLVRFREQDLVHYIHENLIPKP